MLVKIDKNFVLFVSVLKVQYGFQSHLTSTFIVNIRQLDVILKKINNIF